MESDATITDGKIKRKKLNDTSTSTTTTTTSGSSKLPKVDFDTLKLGSYTDLLNDFCELTLCKTNCKPEPPSLPHPVETKETEQEEEEEDSTKKKRKRVPKPPKYDTTVQYDKSILAAKARYDLHIEQCRTIPAEVELFNELKELLVAPTYMDPACPDEKQSQQETVQRLHDRTACLLILKSDHADVLLQEAGEFPISSNPRQAHLVRNFPPCMHGTKCFVNSGRLQVDPLSVTDIDPAKAKIRQKQGFICMQYMDKRTYERFLSTGTPPKPTPCVICCRYQLTVYVPMLRTSRQQESQGITTTPITLPLVYDKGNNPSSGEEMQPQSAEEEEESINWPIIEHDPATPLQFFRERMDKPGGYLSGCMLIPNQGVWEGFLDPISMILLGRLIIKQKGSGSLLKPARRCVNQDLMKYQPDPSEIPNTGESMSRFCSGVDN